MPSTATDAVIAALAGAKPAAPANVAPGNVHVTAIALVEGGGTKSVVVGTADGSLIKFRIASPAPNVAFAANGLSDLVLRDCHAGAITGVLELGTDDVVACGVDGRVTQWNLAPEAEPTVPRMGRCYPPPTPRPRKDKLRNLVPTPVEQLPPPPYGALRCLAVAEGGGDASTAVLFIGANQGGIHRLEGFRPSTAVAPAKGVAPGQPKPWAFHHEDGVIALLTVTGANTLVSGGANSTVNGYDVTTAACTFVFRGHSKLVRGLAPGANPGTFYSFSLDGTSALLAVPAPAEAGADAAADQANGGAADAPASHTEKKPPSVATPAEAPLISPLSLIQLPFVPSSAAPSSYGIVVGADDGSVWGLRTKTVQKLVGEFTADIDVAVEKAKAALEAQQRELVARAERASKKRLAEARKAAEDAATGGSQGAAAAGQTEEDAPPPADLSPEVQARLTQLAEVEAAQLERTQAQIQTETSQKVQRYGDELKKQPCVFTRETVAASSFCHVIHRGGDGDASSSAIVACDGLTVVNASHNAGVALAAWRVGVVSL